MIYHLRNSIRRRPRDLRTKAITIYVTLLALNIFAWLWAVAVFHGNPVLWGTAFLAYSFGLRHAVDADHIAAIHNVTRTMMQSGGQPVTIGLMFSLGHSSVVVAGSMAIAVAASTVQHHISAIRDIGGTIGTLVSTLFLLAIGTANVAVLYSTYLSFKRARRGDPHVEAERNVLSSSRGVLSQLFRPV